MQQKITKYKNKCSLYFEMHSAILRVSCYSNFQMQVFFPRQIFIFIALDNKSTTYIYIFEHCSQIEMADVFFLYKHSM